MKGSPQHEYLKDISVLSLTPLHKHSNTINEGSFDLLPCGIVTNLNLSLASALVALPAQHCPLFLCFIEKYWILPACVMLRDIFFLSTYFWQNSISNQKLPIYKL